MATSMQPQQYKRLTGVVVSAGKMMKTVKVRITEQKWNKQIQKHYASHYNVLVSDPKDSTLEGDIVTIRSGWRSSKHVRHVLESIVAPMSKSVSERPAIPTEVERLAQRAAKRAEKDVRQAARGRPSAIARLKALRQAQAKENTQNRDLLENLESQAQELLKDVKEEAEEATTTEQDTPSHAIRMATIESELQQIQSALQQSTLSSTPSSPTSSPETQQAEETITQAAQEASSAETQAIQSDPDSLPPSGDRSDGQQDIGDLNQRSLHNVRRTIDWRKRAEDNEAEIEKMEKERESKDDAGLTPPEEVIKPGEENQQKKGWFGSFFGGGKS